jgi:hypothetical protein
VSDEQRLNQLAIRFASLLALCGGLLLLLMAGGLALLPTRSDRASFVYVLPGGSHTVDATAALVLAATGGLLAGLGLFGSATASLLARRLSPVATAATSVQSKTVRRPARAWLVMGGGLLFLLAVIIAKRAGLIAP